MLATECSNRQKFDVNLPTKYQTFTYVRTLPVNQPYDCPIDIHQGKKLPWGGFHNFHNLSPSELKVLQRYIDKNLANGFIINSRSHAGAPVVSAKKNGGSLCLVKDY